MSSIPFRSVFGLAKVGKAERTDTAPPAPIDPAVVEHLSDEDLEGLWSAVQAPNVAAFDRMIVDHERQRRARAKDHPTVDPMDAAGLAKARADVRAQAWSTIEKAADVVHLQHPHLTREQAVVKAAEERPELVAIYRR